MPPRRPELSAYSKESVVREPRRTSHGRHPGATPSARASVTGNQPAQGQPPDVLDTLAVQPATSTASITAAQLSRAAVDRVFGQLAARAQEEPAQSALRDSVDLAAEAGNNRVEPSVAADLLVREADLTLEATPDTVGRELTPQVAAAQAGGDNSTAQAAGLGGEPPPAQAAKLAADSTLAEAALVQPSGGGQAANALPPPELQGRLPLAPYTHLGLPSAFTAILTGPPSARQPRRSHGTPRLQQQEQPTFQQEAPGSPPASSVAGHARGLYEALKLQQPSDVQDQMALDEVFWDEKGLQERRQELQRRLKDEEMVERIRRRVAGDKINLPNIPLAKTLARLPSMLLSPRVGAAGTGDGPPSKSPRGQPAIPEDAEAEAEAGADLEAAAGRGEGAEGQLSVQDAVPAKKPAEKWWPKVQHAVQRIVQHPDFGQVIILLIAINCMCLFLYQPQEPDDEGRNATLKTLEIAINVVFTIEVILVCIAAGGFLEYIRSPWNIFDLTMVLVGYTDFIPTGSGQTGGIRALRALRALRPLRTITRFESLRTIVVCFLEALPMLISVFELLFFFLLHAAIMGTILFMDMSHYACFNDATGEQEQDGNPDFACGARECPAGYSCQEYSQVPPINTAGFVSLGASMLTCFQVITLSSWVHTMYATMDSAGIPSLIYFIGIVLLESYFVVNLFLAVLKNKFAKASVLASKVVSEEGKPRGTVMVLWRLFWARIKKHTAKKRALDEQRMSERSSRASSALSMESLTRTPQLTAHSRKQPQGRLGSLWYWFSSRVGSCWFEVRWRVHDVVEHPAFTQFFLVAIVANTILLAMTTASMSENYSQALDNGNMALTVLFAVECLLKLTGLGIYGYASDPWNYLDFACVVTGMVELVLVVGTNGNAMRSFRTLRILRSLRVLRVLKAFRYLQSLRVITDVLLSSMGSFLAIASLMTLFIFCFGVVGLQIMFSVQAQAGWGSTLYFVAWVALGKWCLLTLFLAITLSAFESNYEKYNRGNSTGSLARVRGALGATWGLVSRLCRLSCWRRGTVLPFEEADETYTTTWVASHHEGKKGLLRRASMSSFGSASCGPANAVELKAASASRVAPSSPPPDGLITAVHAAVAVTEVKVPDQQPLSAEPQPPAISPHASALPLAAAGSLACSGTSPDKGHVGFMVNLFEKLSPRKQAASANSNIGQLADLRTAEGEQVFTGLHFEEPTRDAQTIVAPSDGERSAQISRQQSRRTRFADVPDGSDEDVPSEAGDLAMVSRPQSAAGQQPGQQRLTKQMLAELSKDQSVPEDLIEAERRSEMSGLSGASSASSAFSKMSVRAKRRSNRSDYPPLMGTSLLCLKASNRFRVAVYHLVTLQAFDYALVLVVLLSCAEMTLETPDMDPLAYKTRVLHWIDVSTTIVFWIEALLKIIGFSFKMYFSYFTNKVDLAVVVVSTVVLIADSLNARFLKTLRVLRAIKPLRVLTRSMSMLLVFHTLARSLMEMGNVTVLTTMCFLIFAILGVQLFAGMFYSCTDTSVADQEECVGTYIDASGQLAPRQWVNLDNNFDNIGQAFLTLFITATLDGYTPAMYMSMATRSRPGLQPVQGSNPAAFLFWFAYITLVAFFVINLYVGVVFYQFQRLKMLSQTGSAVLTASQTGYVEMMKAVFRLKPLDRAPPPTNPIGRFCHQMAYHPWFDNIMTAIIIANVVLLGTTYYGESASFSAAKEHANTAFSSIVILEFVIKLAAMGPRLYWRNNWNKFDVALTVASLIDIITQILAAVLGSGANLSTIKKIMMLLRTLRLFKVMRRIKGLQILMTTLVVSLPSIVNVGSLLILLFFIYAYMGVILLGNIAHGQALDEHANFDTFPAAMLTLFRVAVGDDWTSLMQDCMVQPPDCDPDAGNCGSQAVWLYFFSFYLAVGLIAFNLFTTVVLENFERVQDTEDWKLTPANLDEFCELWAEYDDGTSLIEPKDLESILLRLKPPMGLGRKATGRDIMRFVYDLQIPIINGKVPFYRTAFELVQRASYVAIPQGELKRKLDRMIKRFLHRHATMKNDDQQMSFDLALTVMRIQRIWRAKVQRRRLLEERKALRRAQGLPSTEEAAPVDLESGVGVEGGSNPGPRLLPQASRRLFRALSRAPSLSRITSLRRN